MIPAVPPNPDNSAPKPPLKEARREAFQDPVASVVTQDRLRFFLGLSLLTLGVPACVVALWLFWGSLIASPGDQVYGPGASAYRNQTAGEVVNLVHGNYERFRWEAVMRGHNEHEGFTQMRQAVVELEERQAAEVWAWRLKQGLLLGLPALLAGLGAGWLGLRILRLLKLPVTDFNAESKQIRRGSGEAPEDTECLECRKRIPAGATKCPGCGWSYL